MATAANTNFDALIKLSPVIWHSVLSKPNGFIRQRGHLAKTLGTIADQPELFLKIPNYFQFRLNSG